MREPVRRELALVLDHGQVTLNDHVGDDFTLAHELWRLRREISHWSSVIWTSRPIATCVGSGIWLER